MKTLTRQRLLYIVVTICFSLPVSVLGQGTFRYHYVIPPDLGKKMAGIKTVAFLDFKYNDPAATEKLKDEHSGHDAGDELLELMIEEKKKEVLGEEEYNRQRRAELAGSNNEMTEALINNVTSLLLIPDRGKVPGYNFLLEGIRTDIYTVVDRATIDKILAEQQLQVSGLVSEDQMAELGELLGADAIITGQLSAEVQDVRQDEKVVQHYKKVKYTDEDGKEKTKEVPDYKEYIYAISRTVTSRLTLKVVSVETGAILGTRNFEESKFDSKAKSFKSKQYAASRYPSFDELTSAQTMIRATINPLSVSMANMIAPRFGITGNKIAKIKTKQFKSQAKEAADYLKRGQVEKAYAIYKTIYDADPYIGESAYNLGMIYEATGQYDKAKEMYTAALEGALNKSNEKRFAQAIERAEAGMVALDILASLGIKPEKVYFSDESAQTLLAEKVTTKGNPKKHRFPVYEKPDAGSAVIGKVPGGREFPKLGEENGFTLIEILGGKRGYIKNSDLK